MVLYSDKLVDCELMVERDKNLFLSMAKRAGVAITVQYAEECARRSLTWRRQIMGGDYTMNVPDSAQVAIPTANIN